jgi:hypothetical protein
MFNLSDRVSLNNTSFIKISAPYVRREEDFRAPKPMAGNSHTAQLQSQTGSKHASLPRLRPLFAPSRGAVGVYWSAPTATFLSGVTSNV